MNAACVGPIAAQDSLELSNAAASIGVFSAANFFSATLSGIPDIALSTTQVHCFEVTAFSNTTQTLFSYANGTTGFSITIRGVSGGINRVALNLRGGGDPVYVFDLPQNGLIAVAFTRLPTGQIRSSFCGAIAIELNAAPPYTNAGAASVHAIGRVAAAVNATGQPATDCRYLYNAFLARDATDAELQLWTGQVNRRHRYDVESTLLAASNLVSQWTALRDWNGVAATSTAGLGSAPITYTLNGAVLLNPIEEEIIYRESASWWANSKLSRLVTPLNGGPAYVEREPFGDATLVSATRKIVVGCVGDAIAVSMVDTGLFVAGVAQGDGLEINQHSDSMPAGQSAERLLDWMNLPAGTKTMVARNGYQARAASVRRGNVITQLRSPRSQPLGIQPLTPPATRLVFVTDSIGVGRDVTSGSANASPCYQCFNQIVKKNSGWGVLVDGFGTREFFDICATTALADAYVDDLLIFCDGTASNWIWTELSTNDYGGVSSNWSAANFQVGVTYLMGQIQARLVPARPDVRVFLQTALTRLNEASVNDKGSNLAAYRTALTTIAAAFPAFTTLVAGPALVTFPTNFAADQLHPNTVGQAQFEANIRPVLGY